MTRPSSTEPGARAASFLLSARTRPKSTEPHGRDQITKVITSTPLQRSNTFRASTSDRGWANEGTHSLDSTLSVPETPVSSMSQAFKGKQLRKALKMAQAVKVTRVLERIAAKEKEKALWEKTQTAGEERQDVADTHPDAEDDAEDGSLKISREEQLSEKEQEEARLQTWKVQSRTFLGVVRRQTSLEYTDHVRGRYTGRDKASGFRTPLDSEYVPVGGEVATVSGEDLKAQLLPGLTKWKVEAPSKVTLPLDHNHEMTIAGSKIVYFEIDVSGRPLETQPPRTLVVQVTVLNGELEMFGSMTDNHEFPTVGDNDWEAVQGTNPEGFSTAQDMKLVVTPLDPYYLLARRKNIMLLKDRKSAKAVEMEEGRKYFRSVRRGIFDSSIRCTRAKSGKTPAVPSNRPKRASSVSTSDDGDADAGEGDISLESFSHVLSRSLDALETRITSTASKRFVSLNNTASYTPVSSAICPRSR